MILVSLKSHAIHLPAYSIGTIGGSFIVAVPDDLDSTRTCVILSSVVSSVIFGFTSGSFGRFKPAAKQAFSDFEQDCRRSGEMHLT
jgi:hypothetical protein